MDGLLIILGSFILAAIVRKIAIAKNECMMTKSLPQLIMIAGGIFGTYVFIVENWKL
jgi:hypothetical protein